VNQVGILLLGAVLGWLVIFGVRRYRVQWGAFAGFMAVIFGVGLLTFLFKADLLGYYGIGIFIGFFANLIVRAVGVATGGKAGEGLLEIAAYRSKGGWPATGDRIREVKEKFETFLLKRANVVGVGVGKKIVRGQETEDLAVVVFVERKLPESQLKKKDVIPKTLDEVTTDVVQTGRLKALALSPGPPGRTDRWRPAPGGVSVGHVRITAGTLGGVVRRGGERLILSNNHVLANSNDARPGDLVLQPGPADSGTRGDALAALDRFVEIRFEDTRGVFAFLRHLAKRIGIRLAPRRRGNFVDAATARPLRGELVADTILGLEWSRGHAEVEAGATVRKSGRTTGVTEGRVLATGVTVQVDYSDRVATFEDQVVAGPMSQGGDSGSLVVDVQGRTVGLLFAGSETTTAFNRASRVAEALGVEF
jgi:hypothetical protein